MGNFLFRAKNEIYPNPQDLACRNLPQAEFSRLRLIPAGRMIEQENKAADEEMAA